LNDAHELIHRLSNCHTDNRLPVSFLQELENDFPVCVTHDNRFNSTMIDEEQHDDCRMDDDDNNDRELLPMSITTHTNEKCLLDELLQTEEVNIISKCSFDFHVACFS
jgi:hypothetical protein